MNDDLYFDGVKYISATDAASASGFTRDYVGKLCRLGKVEGKRIGKNWFVNEASLNSFVISQKFLNAQRRDALIHERVAEYKKSSAPVIANKPVSKDISKTNHISKASYIASPFYIANDEVPEITKASVPFELPELPQENPLTQKATSASVSSLLNAPAGIGHAALHIAHTPLYTITPFIDVLHKMTALISVFVLLFGAYAIVNPKGAEMAINSAHTIVADVAGSSVRILQENATAELASVAAIPHKESLLATTIFSDLARTINTHVDAFIYALSSPQSVFLSHLGMGNNQQGTVSLKIVPYHVGTIGAPSSGIAATTPIHQSPESPAPVSQTIINNTQPVIEHDVQTERVVTVGGVSQDALTQSLQQLNNSLLQRIYATASSNSNSIAQNYFVTAQTNAIDQLNGTAINSPTITGGTINNTAINTTNITTTNLSVTGSLGIGSITSSGTSTLSALALPSYVCSGLGNGGKLTTDASGNVICAADQGGGGSTIAGTSGQVQFNDSGNFGASASFTFSTSTNKLTVTNASTTNVSIAGSLGIGSLTGVLVANNGIVGATSTLSIANGGTGTTSAPTYGQVLLGNSSGGYNLVATSSLGINSGVWGSITGTLSNQTDLQNALNTKLALSDWYATTTDGLKEGTANLYFTNTHAQTFLDTIGKGYFFSTTSTDFYVSQANLTGFSTTSSDYWKTQNNFFSTTSAAFWQTSTNFFSTTSASFFLANNQGNAFSTSSASYFLSNNLGNAFSTTSASAFLALNQGLAFSTTSADAWGLTKGYLTSLSGAASSTLLVDNNSFSGKNTFASATSTSFAITSLANSLLSVNANGSVIATTSIGVNLLTGTLGIGFGGTGTTTAPTYGQLLLGNASGGYTYTATSSLGLASLSSFSALFPLSYNNTTGVFSTAFSTTTNSGIGNNLFVYTSAGGALVGVASSSLNLPNSALTNSSVTINTSPPLSGGGGVSLGSTRTLSCPTCNTYGWEWTALTNWATSTVSTTTAITAPAFFASSTLASQFNNATSTLFSATTAWIGTLNLTNALTVANGGTGSTTLNGILLGNGTSPVNTLTIGSGLSLGGTTLSNSGVTNVTATYPLLTSGSTGSITLSIGFGTTTTNLWSNLQTFNAGASSTNISASGTGYFSTASTTNLTVGIPNAILSTNATGVVSATTSIGTNYLTGTLGTINGTPFTAGSSIIVSSTTLLTNNNSFTGNNIFTNASSSLLSVSGSSWFTGLATFNGGYIDTASSTHTAFTQFAGASSTLFTATTGYFTTASTTNLTLGTGVGFLQSSASGVVSATSTFSLLNNVFGILGVSNGGTNISTPVAAGVLLGNYVGNGYQQLATSSLGLLTTNVAEGSNLYFTNARAQGAVSATFPLIDTAGVFSLGFGTTTTNLWSNLQTFNGGFVSYASSTIGGGSTSTGLTINGAATTTGNTYLGSKLLIGEQDQSWLPANSIYGAGYAYMIGGYISGNNNGINWGTSSTWLSGSGNSDATDYISLATNFTERLRITAGGNIGIGTSTPWAKLSVNSFNNGLSPQFVIASSSGSLATTTSFIINQAGSVGIGTSTPGSILSVQGVGNFVANGTSTITSTGGGLNLSTGCFAVNGACLVNAPNYTFSYPLINTANTISLGFGTTTTNLWSNLQTFNGGASTTNISASGIGYFSTASTTNLTVGIPNAILSTNATGVVSATTSIGTNYLTGSLGTINGSPFTAGSSIIVSSTTLLTNNNSFSGNNIFTNASSTLLSVSSTSWFNGLSSFAAGFLSAASSTVGNGTQAGGLTINGGATTTGNAYFGGTGKFINTLALGTVISCTGGQALQTDASGNISCGSIAVGGASSGGGWTTNTTGRISLSTSTDSVVIGASTTPYAKLTVLSGSNSTTTLALIPTGSQTANIIDIYGTSGSLSSVFTASGSFGVGTTSPAATLSVGGAGYFTGGFGVGVLNNNAGTLQTSGAATIGGALTVTGNSTLTNASTSNFTNSGSTWFTSIAAGSLLSLDSTGKLVATTSIGFNLFTGNLGVGQGGTGSTTLTGILLGNGSSPVNTLTIGSGLQLIGTTLSTNGSGITAIGPLGQTQAGGTQILATSTTGSDFTISASSNTITFNIPSASASARGLLASSDWTNFNNKISSSSLSALFPLSYNSATGVFSTSFSTTTANAFNQLQSFNAGASSTLLSVSGASWFTGLASFGNASSSVFTATTLFATNATTTNLGITGLTNSLLSTNGSGSVVNTTIGSSLSFSSNTLSLNTGNANTFSALQTFNAGASSTNISASGTGYFSTASTTNLTVGIPNAILSTNATGVVSATTSIGTNYLTGTLGTINGTPFTAGSSIIVSSTTLLTNNNSFTGNNIFTNASSSLLSVSGSSWFTGLASFGNASSSVFTATTLFATNATTSALFSTTASSTNLFSATASFGSLALGSATTTAGNGINITSGCFSIGGNCLNNIGLGANTWTGLQTFSAGYIDNASSTHTAQTNFTTASSSVFTATNLFSTTASTTNLTLGTGVGFLQTNASGVVSATSTLPSSALFGTLATINTQAITPGGTFTITAASSSLLGDNNTFSGKTVLGAATTSVLFSTTASSTNLFSQFASFGSLSLGSALPITSGGSNATAYTTGTLLSYNGTSFVSTSTIGNNQLQNSSLTVSAGSGLSGGGAVSLGGSVSLNLNLNNANSFTALQTFNAGASTTLLSISNGSATTTLTAATSTFATGINLSTGCFAVAGNCLSLSSFTGTLTVANGGTGSTTLTGILLGNGTSPVNTLTIGSGLSLGGTTLSNSGVTNVAASYPLLTSGSTGSITLSLGFGTTTTNLWSNLQTFNGGASTSALTLGTGAGFLQTNATGVVSATSTLPSSALFGTLATINTQAITPGGTFTITAASSSLLGDNNTFSGKTVFGSATTSVLFSTTASSTNLFSATASFGSLALGSATTTAGNGINITSGCFSVGGTCLATPSSLLSLANSWSQLQTFNGGASSTNISASGIGYFSTASTTNLTVGIPNAILSTNATGVVSATTSIGTNYLTGTLGTINGTPFTAGSSIIVSSTTLLTNNNSFTGNNIFTNASSSLLSVSGASWFTGLASFGNASSSVFTATNLFSTGATTTGLAITGLTNSLLSTNANGSVVATSSIGSNYITGVFSIAQGGTATSTQVTNGVNYFDGTRITSGTALTFNGTTFGTPLFASTQTSGTSTIASGQGFTIGGSQFVVQQGSGNVGIGTTTPQYKLVVNGIIAPTANGSSGSLGAPGVYWGFSYINGIDLGEGALTGVTTVASDGLTDLSLYGSTGHVLKLGSNGTQGQVVINNGSVGIGTTSPFAKLSLAGNSLSPTALFNVSSSTASATTTVFNIDANGNTTIGGNGSVLTIGGATTTAANGINLTTGCFSINGTCVGGGGGGVTSLAATYPLLTSGSTGAITISTAFGTTTTNTWSQLQTFTSGFVSQSSSTVNGAFTATGLTTLGNASGTVFSLSNGTATTTLFGNATSTFGAGVSIPVLNITSGTTTSVNGFNLSGGCYAIGGNCITLGSFSGIIGISQGGTATGTQVTNGINYFDGTKITSGTALTFDGTNFTTTGSGTFGSNLAVNIPTGNLDFAIQSKTQTSNDTGAYQTFRGGTGGNTVRGVFGFTHTGTGGNTIFTSGELADALALRATGALQFGTNGTGGLALTIDTAQRVGIGTSTPGSLLSVGNSAGTSGINFSTATSTFSNTGGINLTTGCFAVNGTCLTSGPNYTFSYPLINTANTISLGFGTTTTNLWSNLQTFTSGYIANSSSTVIGNFTTTGNISAASSTLGAATSTSFAITGLTNTLLAVNANGSVVATSTIGNNQLQNSSLTVSAGSGLSGGGAVSLGGSVSLNLNLNNANSFTALQTFNAGASTTLLSISNGSATTTLTAATSTFATGINLSTGCFAVAGNCLSLSSFTGTLTVANGGTGSTTLTGILLGNGTSPVNTLTIGSGLSLGGTTLSNSGVTNVAASYPLLTSGSTGSITLSLGFGTTTTNLWSNLQTFNGGASTSALTLGTGAGFLQTNATGVVSATSTLPSSALFGTLATINTQAITPGGTFTITAASSSLLGDNNTFSGKTVFGSATTSVLFSTTASSTNLFSATASFGSLALGSATTTAGNGINITSGCFSVGGTCLATPSSLLSLANSWSQLQTFNGGASSTNISASGIGYFSTASTTNLTVGIPNAILSTNATGVVSATTSIGTNYITGIFSIAQGGTATSTQVTNGVNYFDGTRITSGTALTFNGTTFTASNISTGGTLAATGLSTLTGGFLSQASSTIGGGSTSTGLTIFGGATTTGTAYFAGNVGIGTNTPQYLLDIRAPNNTSNLFNVQASAADGSGGFFVDKFGNSFFQGTVLGYDSTVAHSAVSSGNGDLYLTTDLSGAGSNNNIILMPNGTGKVGIGTTSPFAKLSLAGNSLGTSALFNVSSSTASATTSVFNIDQNGNTTIGGNGSVLTVNGATSTHSNGINLTTGCFSVGGTCLTSSASLLASANAWSSLQTFNGGASTSALTLGTGAGFLQANAAGVVSATNTLPSSALFGTLATVNSQAITAGGTFTITAASSTLLTNNNSFTGNNIFTNASSSLLSVSGQSWFIGLATFGNASSSVFTATNLFSTGATTTGLAITGLANSLLSTNANGSVVATTSIGSNYISGIFSIAQGGTATSTQVTNGVNYFDGTRITSGTALTFNGTTFGTPLFASTQSSGTSTIASGQGFTIGGSQFVVQQGSGNVGIGTSSPDSKLNVASGNITVDNTFGLLGRLTTGVVATLLKYDNTNTAIIGPNQEIKLNGSVTIAPPSTGTITIKGGDADGSTAVGVRVDTLNLLTTAGAKLVSFRNQSIEKAFIGYDGQGYFAGSVGIGTSTPWAKLSVNSFNNGLNPQFVIASSSGSLATTTAFIIDQAGNVGFGTSTPKANFVLNGTVNSGATGNIFQIASSSNQGILILNNNGYLGVGTTTPGSILAIQGVGNFVGNGTTTFTSTGGGINITSGCFSIGGNCLNNIGLGANTWTGLQTFSAGYIDNASSTHTAFTQFANASSSVFTGTTLFATNATTTNLGITGLTNSLLSTNANGSVVATSSIGSNYISGVFSIAQGGTATSTQVTNGVNYFDGTRITSGTALTFNSTTFGTPLFASTQTSGTSTIAAGQGFTIGGSQFVVQQGSGRIGIGTNAPANLLDVRGPANINSELFVNDSGNAFNAAILPGVNSTQFFGGANGGTSFMTALVNGNVGFGTTSPASQLSNSSTNRLDQAGTGLGGTAFNWQGSSAGYVAGIENTGSGSLFNGLLVKTADTSSGSNIFDLVSGATSKFLVRGDGNVGLGTTTPGSLLSLGVPGNASGINFSFATSTFSNAGGINLTTGCFSINGTCVGAGGSASSTLLTDNNTWTGTNVFNSTTVFNGTNSYNGINAFNNGATFSQPILISSLTGASYLLNILSVSNATTDGAGIALLSIPSLGTLTTPALYNINAATSTYIPTATLVSSGSGVDNLTTNTDNQQLNLSNVTLGNLGASIRHNAVNGNVGLFTLSGSPVYNDTLGIGAASNVLTGYGINATVSLTPINTAGTKNRLSTAAGNFSNTSIETGLQAANTNAFGVQVINSASLFSSGSIAYGGYFGSTATASTTYGLYSSVGSSASSNSAYGLYIAGPGTTNASDYSLYSSGTAPSYFAGNLGLGTSTPFALLSLAGTSLGTSALFNISSSTASATTTVFNIDKNGNTTIGGNGSVLTISGATTTASNGINLTTGCFAIGGNCLNNIGLGANTWTGLQTFSAGFLSQSSSTIAGNFTTTGTNVFNGSLGIGSTTPWANLSIQALSGQTNPLFVIASTTGATSTSYFTVAANGNIGIGFGTTTAPIDLLHIPGLVTPTIASTTSSGLSSPNSVTVSGRYAYVASGSNNSLVIFDISNPASPVKVGSTTSGLNVPISVAVSGRYAYVASIGNSALVIFDISNPASPVNVGSTNSGLINPYSVAVSGRYAYVASYNNSALVIFDISNPASPVKVGSTTSGLNNPASVAVSGRYAYVGSQNNSSLVIFDISNPASPVNVGSTNSGLINSFSVAVSGRYAYVASYNGLTIFDISNPTSPINVGSTSSGLSSPISVTVSGRYAYVADQSTGLVIFDISNPASPVNVGSTNSGLNHPDSVAVSGRYAYVASYSNSSLVSFNLGGAYIQSLEAGSLEAGSLNLRNDLQGVNGSFSGGVTASGGLNVGGAFALTASTWYATTTVGQASSIFALNTASSTNPLFNVLYNGNVGIGTSTPFANFVIDGSVVSTKNIFQIASSTNQSIFTLNNNGYLGIGTTTSGSLLSIGNSSGTQGINFSLATTTFSNVGGINLTTGCFSINGNCVGTAAGSNFFTNSGASTWLSTGTNLGIGTTTNLTAGLTLGWTVSGGQNIVNSITLPSATSSLLVSNAVNSLYSVGNTLYWNGAPEFPANITSSNYGLNGLWNNAGTYPSTGTANNSWATVGSNPKGLAFDSAGNLYVANSTSNTVSEVTPAGVVTTFASGLNGPRSVTFDSSGNLYVSNNAGSTISKVTPSGVVTTFATVGSGPADLIFDSSGNLYVANQNGTTVSKVTPSGSVSTFATVGGGPTDLAFDSSGNLYVSNQTGNTVSKVTPAGVVTTFATGLSTPYGLAFDSAGNLYVANNGSGVGTTVSKITPGGTVTTLVGAGVGPTELAFDSAGNLYVANNGSNTVSQVTPSGVVSTFATVGSSPRALIFDSFGNLYVSINGGTTVSKVTGIVNPTANLTISGNTTLAGNSIFTGTTTLQNGLFVGGNVGIGTTTPSALLSLQANNSTSGLFQVRASAANGGGGIDIDKFGNFLFDGGTVGLQYDTNVAHDAFSTALTSLYFTTDASGNGSNDSIILMPNGTGKVGIGTTTPWAKLSVASFNQGLAPQFVVASSSGSLATTTAFIIDQAGKVGIGTSTPTASLSIQGISGQAFQLLDIASSTGASLLHLTAAGNFGIGTSTPWANFTIQPTAGSAVPQFVSWVSGSSSPSFIISSANNNGFIGIGTSTPTANFVLNGTITSTKNIFQISSSTNQSILIVNNNGLVGIGSSTPDQALTVNGNINVAAGKCYMVNGVCIGYITKLSTIYATSTVGTTTVAFTGAANSAPNFLLGFLTLQNNASYYTVESWGGGGGGGAETNSTAGAAGGNSCYSQNSGIGAGCSTTSLVTAKGGSAGGNTTAGAAGAGGASATSRGELIFAGSPGTAGSVSTSSDSVIGSGGASPRGGAGGVSPGTSGAGGVGTGPGGGGAGGHVTFVGTGAGGGGGAYAENVASTSPSTTSTLVVGAGGTGGTGTQSGGAGAIGAVVITIYATSSPTAAGNDYAEMFPVSNPNIGAGDIVAVDKGVPISMNYAVAGSNAPLAGVISTSPGQVLGDQTAVGNRPVALSGRVPVKVNLEGGTIAVGDRIAPSSVPGTGKKAGPFDNSIGIAIANYPDDGTSPEPTASSTVMVFLDLQKGIDINAVGVGLLGQSMTSLFASTTASSTSPLDFVGGVMDAIGARIAALTGSSSTSTATTTTATSTDIFANNLFTSLISQLTNWFASTTNGITDFFANRVHTQELCLSDSTGSSTCITKAQLDTLLAGNSSGSSTSGGSSGGGGSSGSGGGSSTSTPPVLEVSGDNPATVSMGTTYSDMGATITAPAADVNLDIWASVDGATSTALSSVFLDTSATGTHTIIYTATDADGLTGSTTRTVDVVGS